MWQSTFCLTLLLFNALNFQTSNAESATQLISDIYKDCLSEFSTKCIKFKAESWVRKVKNLDLIELTENLSIVKLNENESRDNEVADSYGPLKDVETFLTTHALKVKPPKSLQDEYLVSNLPESIRNSSLTEELLVPLVEKESENGKYLI